MTTRQRLFLANAVIHPPRRHRTPFTWGEWLLLTAAIAFSAAFFGGLAFHLMLFLQSA